MMYADIRIDLSKKTYIINTYDEKPENIACPLDRLQRCKTILKENYQPSKENYSDLKARSNINQILKTIRLIKEEFDKVQVPPKKLGDYINWLAAKCHLSALIHFKTKLEQYNDQKTKIAILYRDLVLLCGSKVVDQQSMLGATSEDEDSTDSTSEEL